MKRALAWALTLALAACTLYPAPDKTNLYACTLSGNDCSAGFACVELGDAGPHCVFQADGGVGDAGDAGLDAGDGGSNVDDAGSDAGDAGGQVADAGDAGTGTPDAGMDAGADAGPDAGTDAGLDAGPTFAPGGTVEVRLVTLSGGPATTILPVSGGDLVLGTSLWLADGGPNWSDIAGPLIAEAVDAGLSSHLEQIAVSSNAWYAEVYQQALDSSVTTPYVLYASQDLGQSWHRVAAFDATGVMAATEDPDAGPVVFVIADAGPSASALLAFKVNGTALGAVPFLDSQHSWSGVASMVPYVRGGAVLLGQAGEANNLDIVFLDAGPTAATFAPLSTASIPQIGNVDVIGPLCNYDPNTMGRPVNVFLPVTDGGSDAVWSTGGGLGAAFQRTTELFSCAFSILGGTPSDLWFVDGNRVLTMPLFSQQPAVVTNPGGNLTLLAPFGDKMWGVTAFGVRQMDGIVDGGNPIQVDDYYFGQSLTGFRPLSGGGEIVLGGSNPAAPVLYEDLGFGFGGASQFSNRSYANCTDVYAADIDDVVVSCGDAGVNLAIADGGYHLLAASGLGVPLPPTTAGTFTLFVATGAGNDIASYSVDLTTFAVTDTGLPGNIEGPIFASHLGDENPVAYAHSGNGQIVLLDGGGAFEVGSDSVLGSSSLAGIVDRTDSSRFDIVQTPGSPPAEITECQLVNGIVGCSPLCALPNLAFEIRFSPGGDLWVVGYPANLAVADLPAGASHLYHVKKSDRALVGLTPLQACPEVTLQWPTLEPEGFEGIGVGGSTIYLTGSHHTLQITY